jgi:hypothetical protein
VKPVVAMQVAARCRRIQGWFSFEAALLFAWIDEVQRQERISGDLFEIGVHHGRSAILLSHLLDDSECLGVCDLFGEQINNASGSGSGNRAQFDANMRRLGAPQAKVRVFSKRSALLSADEVGAGVRFFHVDGGHNADEALADLQLAAACTGRNGAIVVDDPFRIEWPGVTEAVVRFLDGAADYSAVAVGFNKLLVTHVDAVDIYARRFDEARSRMEYGLGYPWALKTLPFLGRPLRIFHMPSRVNQTSLRSRVEQLHRTRPWARRPVPARVITAARRLLA